MKKYKVKLHLMKDPTVNDETFSKTYIVEANDEISAYYKAEVLQSNDQDDYIRKRSIYNYTINEIF